MYVRQSNAAVLQLQQQPQHPGLTARKTAVAAATFRCRSVGRDTQQQLLLRRPAAAGTGSSAAGAGSSSWVRSPEAPWSLTFDLRERETEWTDANKVSMLPCGGNTPLGVDTRLMAVHQVGDSICCSGHAHMLTMAEQNRHCQNTCNTATLALHRCMRQLPEGCRPMRSCMPQHQAARCCACSPAADLRGSHHCLQSRLVALVAAQQLSIPMADMEQRLEELMTLLPDLRQQDCSQHICSGTAVH
jgi:hypothetical protein